jgi:major membrane immunogen (membrane-anchored lipoprotein)
LGAVQAPAMAAPPSLTITQPSANGSTRDATTVFAGTTSDTVDSVTLAIYAGTDTQVPPVQTSLAIVPVGESWETSAASSLSDGQYTAVVEQTNGAETGSSSVAFTVDTTKPVVSLDLVTSPTIESSPTLTGSAGELPGDSSNVAVTIYDGGSVGGTVARSATVEVSGSRWQYKPEALVDGTYTAQAVQQDAAGNVGESVLPVTFTVDTPAPVVSLNSLPAWTKSSTPTLTGGAGSLAGDRATVHVTVYDGSSVGGAVAESSTVAVSASKWSDTVATLTDGTYTAQVSQEDEAGNVGTSTAVTFTVDTVAPVVSINAVTPPTRNSTPTFTGVAGVLAGDKASVVVTIHEGSSVAGTVVETKAVSPSGSSWSDTPPGLVDGTYTAQVTQEDQAGNVGKSAPVTFTVDTKAPVVSIVAPASRIKESTPTLTGKLGTLSGDDPSVLITIHEGGSVSDPVLGSPSAALVNGSSWTYTAPTLADGTYTVQASQEDEAGNLGKSVAVTFTVDTVAPVVSIEPLASPTKDSTPTLTGAAGVLAGDIASVTVTIYAVESSGDVLLESKAINVSGSTWSYTTPSLGDRTYKVDVSQEDEAGNRREAGPITFTVDTHAPAVSINGVQTPSNDPTPTLSGAAGVLPADDPEVKLTIRKGESVVSPEVESATIPVSNGSWSFTTKHLSDGAYTAQVTQENGAEGVGVRAVVFVIDTTAPKLTLTSPSNDAVVESSRPTFGGQAGNESGDSTVVKLSIYTGTSTAGSPIQTFEASRSGTEWTSGSAGPALANGIYTVLAEQVDDAGNATTGTATFAVAVPSTPPPAPSPPPVASFQWFPASPHVGEAVSLVSTSSDAGSPITTYAWSLLPGGALVAGQHVLSTSFATAGSHVVRLRVTDASGLSSEVSETITVASQPITLMQPFPVVRIAGSAKSSGVRIALFTVLAPVGARVSVTCHGHGCPPKTQSLVVAAKNKAKGGTVLVSFGRFERWLRAGAVLEVRIFKAGQIGKYTRFTVRRGKLPARVDTCLSSSGTKPMTCPSS